MDAQSPESKLVEQMEYYIRPEQEETEFLKIGSPEEIKVCDPACGSGHMLTYAFDLLHAIYEEQGYDPVEIPRRILENNLYGIEIDERAGHLAAFALMMKARARDRRFFTRGVEPNICVLENVVFTDEELDAYMDAVGRDLFTQDLQETLTQFEQADNFGSLIQPKVKEMAFIRQRIEEQGVPEDLFLHRTNQKVLKVLEQADYLSPGYHVVVANPPYLGTRNMASELRLFARNQFPETTKDLFAMFIERNMELSTDHGLVGMITMQSWMFLSSYEWLRNTLLNTKTILSLTHLGAGAFDSIGGEVVSTVAFIFMNGLQLNYEGIYCRLVDGEDEKQKQLLLRTAISSEDGSNTYLFIQSAKAFKKIPGFPIAYWVNDGVRRMFENGMKLQDMRIRGKEWRRATMIAS